MSTTFLRAIVKNSKEPATASLIFLHGLGDSGHGWSDIAGMLSTSLPHVRFIFPHAPEIPVTLNFGMRMPAWYDIYNLNEILEKEDEKGMMESVQRVLELVKKEVDAGIAPERIVVGGFSQGGAMAYLTSLVTEYKLGGVVALSGYLPLRNKVFSLTPGKNQATPMFSAHGTADNVVPFQFGKTSADILMAKGYPLQFKSYQGLEHSSSMEELSDLKEFLMKCVPEK